MDFATPPMRATDLRMAEASAMVGATAGAAASGEGSVKVGAADTAETSEDGPFTRHGVQGTPRPMGRTP